MGGRARLQQVDRLPSFRRPRLQQVDAPVCRCMDSAVDASPISSLTIIDSPTQHPRQRERMAVNPKTSYESQTGPPGLLEINSRN